MKKTLSLLIAAAMIAGSLAGCGTTKPSVSQNSPSATPVASSEAPNEPAKPKEIRWLAPGVGEKSWEGLMVPVLEKYQEKTGVKVIGEHYAYNDLMEVIEVKIASGSADYDVITVDAPLVAAYASRGYLLPAANYFTEADLSELTKASVEAGSWENEFYVTPLSSSAQVLWYNTDLLAQAGVTIRDNGPNNRLTYEEIADMAKEVLKVVNPDGKQGIFGLDFHQVSRLYQMNPLANSRGGLNIGEGGMTLEGVLDSEPWISALTWYQDLVKSGLATRGISADELPNYFYSDKLVFMIGASYIGTNCDANGMNHYGYTYLPAFKGYENSVGSATGSWGFGINKASKNPDQAADFMKFLSIGEGNDMWLKIRGEMPARNSALQNIINDNSVAGYLKIGAYEAMNTAVPRALTPAFNEYSTLMDSLWEDVRNGADIKESVANTISQFNTAVQAHK